MLGSNKIRHFLWMPDLSKKEIMRIIEKAYELKKNPTNYKGSLDGKVIALIFDKPSTRTRVSFEVASYKMKAYPIFLASSELHIGKKESIKDTARVLSSYVDCIIIRTYAHSLVEEFAKYSRKPVINALTDSYHPTQGIADFLTMYEVMKEQSRDFFSLKLAFLGDGNNVLNTLILTSAILGTRLTFSTPRDYKPKKEVLEIASEFAARSGAIIEYQEDPVNAIRDADFVYTDVWVSMGDDENKDKSIFKPYQVNRELLQCAKPNVRVLHCLPAVRGEEITEDVIDDDSISLVFTQAENKLFANQSILLFFLGEEDAT